MGEQEERLARKNLALWFERQKRVLPWRENPTLYRVWVSEIMLQQTQVAAVVPYFERMMARFPSVEAMAEAEEDEVVRLWSGLGYYSRARNLHRTAREIVRQGDFPRSRDAWLEMPGVGPYTAGAILSIALKQPEAILDGNVERVFSRLDRLHRTEIFKKQLWSRSRQWVEAAAREGICPSVLNQALMEVGAILCHPKRPLCRLCPLQKICEARAHGDVERFPERAPQKKWVEVQEQVHGIWHPKKGILIHQSQDSRWRQGLWDLPAEVKLKWKKNLVLAGEVTTHHVVTRHRITRKTKVWRCLGSTPRLESQERWLQVSVNWEAPPVAVGSALKKTMRAITASLDREAPKAD